MTEIPELSGDIAIMRTKLNKQAEVLRAQAETIRELRAAVGEAREVIRRLTADVMAARAQGLIQGMRPLYDASDGEKWLAAHKEE